MAAPEATPAVDGGFRLQLRRTAPLGRAACCRLPRTRRCIGSGVEFSGLPDTANSVELPSYTVVDATVSWHALPNTTLGVRLNNLFNRQYAVTQYNGGQQWIMGEPRSFFVTADYAF